MQANVFVPPIFIAHEPQIPINSTNENIKINGGKKNTYGKTEMS